MTKVEAATTWMERLAADNSHGYSQTNRWGPDYDCSSAVIQAWENAGVPVKTKGATYTGNMYPVFMACGFTDVTPYVNLYSGAGLKRGDVLLNHADHTAMVVGPGRVVHARGSEGHPEAGDQTGNEIRTQNYWNYPWNCVLRYPDVADDDQDDADGTKPDGICRKGTWEALSQYFPVLRYGSIGAEVETLQAALNKANGCLLDVDGEFGPLTEYELREFQEGIVNQEGIANE
jgi:hypothetical protein